MEDGSTSKRLVRFSLQTADSFNKIFVRTTGCLQLIILPQLNSYQLQVFAVFISQLLSSEFLMIMITRILLMYFSSPNSMLLLTTGAFVPFLRVVRSVWTLIPCPPIASYVSNIALISALVTLVALGVGTFGNGWIVYTYTMMVWPWLVLASMVSRLFVERIASSGPFSPIRDLPFLGIVGAVSQCLMMLAVKQIQLSDCIALSFLDPILGGAAGCLVMGSSRVKLHSKFVKIYVCLAGLVGVYIFSDIPGGSNGGMTGFSQGHAMFLAARVLLVFRSFYVKWAYSNFYKATAPGSVPETELIFYNTSPPRKHRFERFPEPVLFTLDGVFDSALKDIDLHGMGPLGTTDLYNLTEAAYTLPISALMSYIYEFGTVGDGPLTRNTYASLSTAVQIAAEQGQSDVAAATVRESFTMGEYVVAIVLIFVYCLGRVLIPFSTSQSLFSRASPPQSWTTRPVMIMMPFFLLDVLYINVDFSKMQIVILICLFGLFAFYRTVLWDVFKRRYFIYLTQELQYFQPSCCRSLQRTTMLEFMKNTSTDDYGLLLVNTAIRHGANIRELARDTNIQVWDPQPTATAAWKLAFSLVTKSLRRNKLKKMQRDKQKAMVHEWLGLLVHSIVDKAVDTAAGHGNRLRHAGILADMFSKRRAVRRLQALAARRRDMRLRRKAGQLSLAPGQLATTGGVLRSFSDVQPKPAPGGVPALPPPPTARTFVGSGAIAGAQQLSLTASSTQQSTHGQSGFLFESRDALSLPGGVMPSEYSRTSADISPNRTLVELSNSWLDVPQQRGVWAVVQAAVAGGAPITPGGTVVLVFGDGQRGQLALTPEACRKHVASGAPVSVVDELRGHEPLQVEASGVATFVLASPGNLWAFGSNRSMELGLRKEITQLHGPQRVKSVREYQLVQVSSSRAACGQAHTLALTGDGLVYTFGTSACGALGQGAGVTQSTPLLLRMSQEQRVKLVAAGVHHSLMVTDSGRVYAFGDNQHGQLGVDQSRLRVRASDVPESLDYWTKQVGPVRFVACGDDHSLAVTEAGKLYSWGANANGQLGIDSLGDRSEPTLVSSVEGISSAACGSRHTVVVSRNGTQVWSWGSNVQGQLGIGPSSFMDGQQRIAPSLVQGLSGKPCLQIVQVAAAASHTLAVTHHGEVYAFGDNTYGQLGFIPEGRATAVASRSRRAHEVDAPILYAQGVPRLWTPERILGLSLWRVRSIATGEMHSVALAA